MFTSKLESQPLNNFGHVRGRDVDVSFGTIYSYISTV